MISANYDTIIIGGGLAGLCSSIALARSGLSVLLIEKKSYPFHKVCGEYISKEVIPYLQTLEADPMSLNPASISRLMVSSPSGSIIHLPLDLGGIGISRYNLDTFLYKKAVSAGVKVLDGLRVEHCHFDTDRFRVHMENGENYQADIVIGAFGKRSNLDKRLQRSFISKRSPYVAVKYHIKTDHPRELIALHNFKDGYCGISAIEENTYCLCYLTTRNNLQRSGSIPVLEDTILCRNPYLRMIFNNSGFLYKKPLVINEISFDSKEPVQDHILMAGDAAGMITPLCGNGMAMAIHASRILSELVIRFFREEHFTRAMLEDTYTALWKKEFETRMSLGRNVQKLFGNELLTDVAIKTLRSVKPLANWLVRNTHGQPF